MIKCWICGNEAVKTRATDKELSRKTRCYCMDCWRKVLEQEANERAEFVRLRKREMFRKACLILEKQNTDMYDYREAIDVVEDHLAKHPDKYDSSYEVLTAIVLVHNRIRVKMQYKIKEYQVDCLLPDYSLVLEIDGERHQNRREYDDMRSVAILKALGAGWNIMRVRTTDLDKNAKKLPEAIDKFLDYQETGKIDWRKL